MIKYFLFILGDEMKENERLEVIKRIKEDIEREKDFRSYLAQLKELLQDENVKSYLEIKNHIENVRNEQLLFNGSYEKMINLEFSWAFNSRLKGEDFSLCKHDIWVYTGSYARDLSNKTSYLLSEDEHVDNFKYNSYECLECGKKLNCIDWLDFESKNFVLKDRNNLDVFNYRKLYYQLLFEHSVSESQEIVIKEFNSRKVKKLKKDND